MKRYDLLLRIIAPLGILIVLTLSAAYGSREEIVTGPTSPPVHTDSPAEILAHQHGCWSGEAPADMQGALPGHVVVLKDGHPVYGGTHLVGAALDQIFNHRDHGLTVIAFCR